LCFDEAKADLGQADLLDPHIADEGADEVFRMLLGWAKYALIPNPVEYVHAVFSHLPDSHLGMRLRSRQRDAVALAEMTTFYRAYRDKNVHGDLPQWLLHPASTRTTPSRFRMDPWMASSTKGTRPHQLSKARVPAPEIQMAFAPQHEQAVVLQSIRAALNLDTASKLDEFTLSAIDWNRVATIANRQAVAPMTYRGLAACGYTIPEESRAVLRATVAASATRDQLWLKRTLAEAIGALRDEGIDPIVLKGTAVAHTVYPEPWLRALGDVDLLVPRADLPRADSKLRERGFWGSDTFQVDFPKVDHHTAPLQLPSSTIALELHHQILSEPHPYRFDVDGLRTRAQRKDLGGVQALVLAPADAIHHASVHLSYAHRYEVTPLRGLVDILGLANGQAGPVDWEGFLQSVKAARTSGAVYWPLRMAREWLDAPIPNPVLDALSPPVGLRKLLAGFLDPDFLLEGRPPSELGAAALFGLLRDLSMYTGCSARVQAWALWRYSFPPPDDVGHLPAEVTQKPVRFTAYLANPLRLSRGVLAFGRLVVRGRTVRA